MKALGQEVVGSLTPGQALIGVVHKELTDVTDQEVFRLPAPLDLGGLFVLFKLDRRMIPEENPAEVEATLRRIIQDRYAHEISALYGG